MVHGVVNSEEESFKYSIDLEDEKTAISLLNLLDLFRERMSNGDWYEKLIDKVNAEKNIGELRARLQSGREDWKITNKDLDHLKSFLHSYFLDI
jgi:hypothetical protein